MLNFLTLQSPISIQHILNLSFMIKRLTLALIAIGFISVCSIAQTSLEGKVIDDNGEPVLFGDVAVFRNDVLVTGTQTVVLTVLT